MLWTSGLLAPAASAFMSASGPRAAARSGEAISSSAAAATQPTVSASTSAPHQMRGTAPGPDSPPVRHGGSPRPCSYRRPRVTPSRRRPEEGPGRRKRGAKLPMHRSSRSGAGAPLFLGNAGHDLISVSAATAPGDLLAASAHDRAAHRFSASHRVHAAAQYTPWGIHRNLCHLAGRLEATPPPGARDRSAYRGPDSDHLGRGDTRSGRRIPRGARTGRRGQGSGAIPPDGRRRSRAGWSAAPRWTAESRVRAAPPRSARPRGYARAPRPPGRPCARRVRRTARRG